MLSNRKIESRGSATCETLPAIHLDDQPIGSPSTAILRAGNEDRESHSTDFVGLGHRRAPTGCD